MNCYNTFVILVLFVFIFHGQHPTKFPPRVCVCVWVWVCGCVRLCVCLWVCVRERENFPRAIDNTYAYVDCICMYTVPTCMQVYMSYPWMVLWNVHGTIHAHDTDAYIHDTDAYIHEIVRHLQSSNCLLNAVCAWVYLCVRAHTCVYIRVYVHRGIHIHAHARTHTRTYTCQTTATQNHQNDTHQRNTLTSEYPIWVCGLIKSICSRRQIVNTIFKTKRKSIYIYYICRYIHVYVYILHDFFWQWYPL